MLVRNKKIVFPAPGDASQVTVVNDSIDHPAGKDLQVQILYSGFGGADVAMRRGSYPLQKKHPLTPGYSLVGRVVAIGSNTTKFQPGDLIASLTVYDSEAEYINLPEKYCIAVDEGLKSKLPQVTALILDWTTAYGAVYRAAKVQRDQRVFVHGMSGAVGYALTRLCQRLGATVYGTASPKNHQPLKDIGAIPFAYSNKDWIQEMKKIGGVHACFDPLGFESNDESWDILCTKEKSVLVGYGGNLVSLNGQENRSVVVPTLKLLARGMIPGCPKNSSFFWISRDQSTFQPELRECMRLLKDGEVDVRIKKCYDGLEEVQQAHRDWEGAKLTGIGSITIKIGV